MNNLFSVDFTNISESSKIFSRISKLLEECEKILDFGCGKKKIHDKAIGVDLINYDCVDYVQNLNEFPNQPEFPDKADVVLSSFCLCELDDPFNSISDFLRVTKIGGMFVVFEPHPSYVPTRGLYKDFSKKFNNLFTPADLMDIFVNISGVDVIDMEVIGHDVGEDFLNFEKDCYGTFAIFKRAQ